jgi:hypothetical protein
MGGNVEKQVFSVCFALFVLQTTVGYSDRRGVSERTLDAGPKMSSTTSGDEIVELSFLRFSPVPSRDQWPCKSAAEHHVI